MKAKKNTYRKTVSTFSVGAPGFEPGTPCSQSRCATGLRYAPKNQRWRRDSNPRYRYQYVSLANWWFKPLTHSTNSTKSKLNFFFLAMQKYNKFLY